MTSHIIGPSKIKNVCTPPRQKTRVAHFVAENQSTQTSTMTSNTEVSPEVFVDAREGNTPQGDPLGVIEGRGDNVTPQDDISPLVVRALFQNSQNSTSTPSYLSSPRGQSTGNIPALNMDDVD